MSDEKMTSEQIELSDAEHDVFDRVRREHGLASVAEAIEWLVRIRLRKGIEQITGRRRGPRLATSGGKSQ
jgi:hypothetical protein